MSAPDFIISKADRTPGGLLGTRSAQQASAMLSRGDFVLVPSDTCYSLAALATRRDTFRNVNTILNRGEEPMSLAFASYLEVRRYVDLELLAQSILENFTPGPVTVVCTAHPPDSMPERAIPDAFFDGIVGSGDRTIGVRLPDSIERDIASTAGFPITSVALRDKGNQPVRDFDQALEIVSEGIDRLPGKAWGAIQGDRFEHELSSVVRVERGAVRKIRDGAIPFEKFIALQNSIPVTARDNRS